MSECIFCSIAKKEIPSKAVFEDDLVYCFYDLEPQAPTHVLLIPKEHIDSIDELEEKNQELMGYMMLMTKKIAKKLNLENGYRVVINTGEDGQQTVKHLHFHILGNRKLTWPPG